MSRLNPTKDERTTYDAKNGAVRSFFGSELVSKPTEASGFALKASSEKANDFLAANKDLFHLENISLKQVSHREGAATESLSYHQEQDTIPVHDAELIVAMNKSGQVTSAVNKLDYDVPPNLSRNQVKLTSDNAETVVQTKVGPIAKSLTLGTPVLYIYRYHHKPPIQGAQPDPVKQIQIEALESGQEGHAYLAWKIPADTQDPPGNWDIYVDAVDGGIIAVRSRRRFATVKGMVFMPDPITSSQNSSLSSSSPAPVLDPLRQEVDLENLHAAVGGKFKLDGKWAFCQELESPTFAPPTTASDFRFSAKDRNFLSVMAYYWVDRVITYLQSLGNPTYNAAVENTRIMLDAQGVDGQDNSHFTTDSQGRPYLAFGEGGVPDASDAHVIVHEYGHAMHFYMGTHQNAAGTEEGYGDFLAGSWLDRFNIHAFQRENVFPWDNNPSSTDHYTDDRRFNTTRKFSDANYNSLEIHVRGSVFAATLWDLYNALGGQPAAADTVNTLYLEMLLSVTNNASISDMAKGLVSADQAINAGVNKAAIKKAFADRGLTI